METRGSSEPVPLLIWLCLCLLLLLISPPSISTARAQGLCTQPIVPTCLEMGTTYDAEEDKLRCKQDVEEFGEEMTAFGDCLQGEADRAEKTRNQVMEHFQCRLEGGKDCPPAPDSASGM